MAKAIREATGKDILVKYLRTLVAENGVDKKLLFPVKTATVTPNINYAELAKDNPWLETEKLVAKPDQLLKRRGKLGLVKVNATYEEVQDWIGTQMERELKVESATGMLNNFIIEPFVAHLPEEEFYVSILANREGNTVLFHHEGGVDVGDVDTKALRVEVAIESSLTAEQARELVKEVPEEKQDVLVEFLRLLYRVYSDLYFTLLEINPLVVQGNMVNILDLAAKLDSTAEYLCKAHWGEFNFPPPFGREALPEEAYIADLDAKSGASLKLTVLNPRGRVWTMVAGGGASVVYSDTICDLGWGHELANYGEYSGAPSEGQTFEYAKTILSLMTKEEEGPEEEPDSRRGGRKILIIGGGIANFTNVASTFKGIVRALKEFQHQILKNRIGIFVRRGGPNYQEGLRVMRETGNQLGLDMHVFGPETHMTAIVGMALDVCPIPKDHKVADTASSLLGAPAFSLPSSQGSSTNSISELVAEPVKLNGPGSLKHERSASPYSEVPSKKLHLDVDAQSSEQEKVKVILWTPEQEKKLPPSPMLFTNTSVAIIWGMQPRAVQSMLDYDHMCSRQTPSVAAMVYPFSGNHKQKFYWGHKEIMVPVYKNMSEAVSKHPEADVLVNFASLRSAYDATVEAIGFNKFKTIAIIAEGIPENKTKQLIKLAKRNDVTIIGPATVGGIKPGCFKIGNTGGMMDNIVSSKLYRPGSVAYVSRSGGMSNELNNIISRCTNGVYEGVAIGGDRYPGTTFMDHVIRYHDDPNVKLIVVLGEVGGIEEYAICEAIKTGRIFKPLVAWCIGTCANMFTSEVQFGHAGACANADRETALAKNKALREVGAFVPDSFDTLGTVIGGVYEQLVAAGIIVPVPEKEPPTIPMDYKWAQELGLIRKPAAFMSSICDERGEELLYAGMPISDVFKDEIGIGGVLSLLWFQRRLPEYACKFLEMCLMVTADHGPAVSGAHNTIVTARAGKDLVSSLTSGLLTIGDRFGGALDGAAQQFSEAYDSNMVPMEFVNSMRKQHKLIMGIGHKVKSLNNPDMRVVLLKEYAKKHFPATPLLDYAIEVEKITTSKKPNLILNVDGVIATSFVDLLRHSGAFTPEECTEYIEIGSLNGLFVLGRTIGFIGHFLDQKRLKQGLYRHPWDDISYLNPDAS